MERIGLIAGNGSVPLLFARTARGEGVGVVAVAHEGETDPALAGEVDACTWIKVGQLDTIIRTFRDAGVRRAVMAGGIRKAALLEHFAPDERAQRFLARLTQWSDDVLLRGVAEELEGEGIAVVESTLFLASILTPEGALTAREPDAAQWADIRHGLAAAKGIGAWDIGQTVVVKSRMVLAVEALEGTDDTLRRGGALGRGGAVAVKVSKPSQDLRFDVPAIGPATVAVCREAGIAVLALEAGRTLLLERERLLADAAAAELIVVGVRADA
ncbi:MAG TPA: UDP-2,3-diacylglucosamine diphosphatase LpxI [Candidatus Dormibacteraeota bacterium]|nr:UDP-2,3-diacylglucosamine diphosphatase LpxI [Candidatus Dormibacteraeota bacterium]